MKRFFLIVSLFTCVLLFAAGVFLKKGIQLESFSAGPATVSNVSLKWQNKLELQIEDLFIELAHDETGKNPPDLSFADKIVPTVQWIDRFFSKISIQKIRVAEISGSLLYQTSLGYITLSSSLLEGRAIIRLDTDKLIVEIEDLRSEEFHSHASGRIQFDLMEKSGSGEFTANIAESLPVSLKLMVDDKQLSFEGQENGDITTITPFVDLFGLKQSIQCWITEYLKGSRYQLKTFKGDFPWDNPLHILESFYAEARANDCEYTFAPGLEAIKSEYADVVFQKGVLVIKPQNATFYGQDTEDSWLDINFNDHKNILLTAYIQTHAQANQDIVNLVEYYNIPLPFKQTEGKTAADLTLTVNFNTEQVTALGTFVIDEGRVDYNQKNYGVKNAVIGLDETVVTFKHLEVSFGNMFVADITGMFDAGMKTGNLDIILQEASFAIGTSLLILDGSLSKPALHYEIQPEGATISGTASSWKLDVIPLQFGSFKTSFSLEDFSGKLAPMLLSFPPGGAAEVSGSFSISDQVLDLKTKLLKCKLKTLEFVEGPGPLSVKYNDGLTIQSAKESKWLLDNVSVVLSPVEFRLADNVYSVISGGISYGKIFESNLAGQYSNKAKQGQIQLNNLVIKEESLGRLLTPDNVISVQVDGRDGKPSFIVPELAVEFSSDAKKSWSLIFNDLGVLYEHSPILQKYMVDAGNIAVVSLNDGQQYHFSADIPYDYSLLIKDGNPVDRYTIYGDVSDDGISATINQDILLSYEDELSITLKGIFFNLPEFGKLLKELPKSIPDDSIKKKEVSLRLEAVDTGFFLTPGRVILADLVNFEYLAGKTTAHLEHGEGTVDVDLEGVEFSMAGDNLNNIFINALFPGSEFDKGTMEMAAQGTFDTFSAVIKIENAIMKNFNLLNNVLAMVNTIPALITFSMPSYSLNGLPVDYLVGGMSVKDGLGTFDSLELESPEISMAGAGWIDFVKKQIGMDLNLVTRAKQNMSKIPLVGYILVGKEKRPSITVKVSGDLLNPTVEHSIFQEVATQPFSMVYRTLALPSYLVSHMFGSGDEDDSADGDNDTAGEEEFQEQQQEFNGEGDIK